MIPDITLDWYEEYSTSYFICNIPLIVAKLSQSISETQLITCSGCKLTRKTPIDRKTVTVSSRGRPTNRLLRVSALRRVIGVTGLYVVVGSKILF